jgi:hypothetical protein
MRTFPSGATRDDAEGKPDYAGYFSPLSMKEYGEYMLKHQKQADGEIRDSRNWVKGIPKDAYVSSLMRHVEDVHMEAWGYQSREGMVDALCAIIFNSQGLLHVLLSDEIFQRESI